MSRKEELEKIEAELVADIEDEHKDTAKYARQAEEAKRLNLPAISETLLALSTQESHHASHLEICLGQARYYINAYKTTRSQVDLETAWEDFRHREQTGVISGLDQSAWLDVAHEHGISDAEAMRYWESKEPKEGSSYKGREVPGYGVRIHDLLLKRDAVPMPGDVVEVVSSDDVLIKPVGGLYPSYGVIEGTEGIRKESYAVTFNPSPLPWWDKVSHVISSSGGPEREIRSSDLKYTGRTKDQEFQYFPGLPQAHSAKTEVHTVYVWQVDLTQQTQKYRTSEADNRFREKLPQLMGELPSGDSYDQIKRRIHAIAEQLHGLVYIQLKQEHSTFDEETLKKWSNVVILEKRDWFYMDVHNKRFEIGKRTGDTYIESKHIGKIQALTAEDLFKAM